MSLPNEVPNPHPQPILCYVTDRQSLQSAATPADSISLLSERIAAVISAGVDWIQLREKDLCARELARLARSARELVRSHNSAARILVNSRLDVALASGCGGVHLSENALPVSEAVTLRREFFAGGFSPAQFLIGASCHSLEAALAAARSGADYVSFGPIFDTPSKAGYGRPQGLDLLSRVASAVSIPVIAIGGITLKNLGDCLRAGASGVAAIRLFQDAPDLTVVKSCLS